MVLDKFLSGIIYIYNKKGKHYYVRPLEFSDPKKMVIILNDMKQKPSSGGSNNTKGASSSLSDFEVIVDEVNSTLLIHATSEDYSKLNEIIFFIILLLISTKELQQLQ